MKQSTELKDKICKLISDGMTVAAACKEAGIGKETLYGWVRADKVFMDAFDRAKDERIEAQLDDAIECFERVQEPVGDGFDNARVQAARLKVDTIKWFASKRLSKKYGDKIEHSGQVSFTPAQFELPKPKNEENT